MKRGVLWLLVCILSISLAAAACTDSDESGDYPDGDDYYTWGYVTDDGDVSIDACTSSTQLREQLCVDGDRESETTTCSSGCFDGRCFDLADGGCANIESASEELYCNSYLDMWCDSLYVWNDDAYCDLGTTHGCYGYDSSCDADTCIEDACDYEARAYCIDDAWYTQYYCDDAVCGSHDTAQAYCYCDETVDDYEEDETTCNDSWDNDCDGDVDCNDSDCEGQTGCECELGDTQSCSEDVGICEEGEQSCEEGVWGACSGIEPEEEELCDELDNDCDGEVDEECTCLPGDAQDCGENIGVCKAGVQTCQDDGGWSICYGASYAASEIEECNGLDDDCDGNIDEGCECTVGTNQSCGSTVGYCDVGTQSCDDDGTWGSCDGEIDPFTEVCGDLIDNDCDGYTDYDDDNCNECGDDSHCDKGYVCSSGACTADTSTEEDAGCSADGDCETGYECDDGACVEMGEEGDTVPVSSDDDEEEDAEEDSSSSSLDGFGEEEEGIDLFLIVVPLLMILVVLGGGTLLYIKKKKGKAPGKASVPGVHAVPMQALRPSASIPSRKSSLKSAADKKFDESFSKSDELFKR